MPIHWRSEIDIDEENRYSPQANPDRIISIQTVPCASCGSDLTEITKADGRVSWVEYGVRTVVGQGVFCRSCPTVREDDLRHDADLERDGPQE